MLFYTAAMSWHARLSLDYHLQHGRTALRFAHEGPLRVLQSLYPEGNSVCHNVLVHPPGGLVGGDTLQIDVQVREGAHALLTTPGATRFYRSEGDPAQQRTRLDLAPGARLEWLPLEALCYNGCLAHNRLEMHLAAGAELIGWDITALGLPGAGKPFEHGHFAQHIEMPGRWLERGTIHADDATLMDGPLGLAGQRCLASLFLCSGEPLSRERREQALDGARALLQGHLLQSTAGVTSPHPQVVVLRVLAPLVEPVALLLRQVRAAWRQSMWAMDAPLPRVWAT